MMKKTVMTIAVAVSLTLGSAPARASWPVIDFANLAQAIMQFQQLMKQYQTLQNQLAKLERQLKTARKQLSSMTGTNNFAQRFHSKYWMNWHGINGNAALQEYGLQVEPAESWSQETIEDTRRRHELMARRAKALQKQLQQAKQRFHAINQMIQKLDSTRTLKAVNDLQTRIAGEQAMLLNALLRLQLRQAQIRSHRIRIAAQERAQGMQSLLQYVDTSQ